MDNLFLLRNANGEIAVNDTYKNFTFLGKFLIPTKQVFFNDAPNVFANLNGFKGSLNIDLSNNPFEIDYRDLSSYHKRTLCLIKTDESAIKDAHIDFDIVNGVVKTLTITARSNMTTTVEVAIYTYARRVESKAGLVIYNQDGDVVFDALKGFLQVICVINEKIDLYQDSIDFKLPEFTNNLDISNIYIGKLNELPELELYAGTRPNYYAFYFPQVIEKDGKKYLRVKTSGRGGVHTKILKKKHDLFSALVAYIP